MRPFIKAGSGIMLFVLLSVFFPTVLDALATIKLDANIADYTIFETIVNYSPFFLYGAGLAAAVAIIWSGVKGGFGSRSNNDGGGKSYR